MSARACSSIPIRQAGRGISIAPKGPVVGLEIPRLDLAEAGVGPAERIAPGIAAALELLAAG